MADKLRFEQATTVETSWQIAQVFYSDPYTGKNNEKLQADSYSHYTSTNTDKPRFEQAAKSATNAKTLKHQDALLLDRSCEHIPMHSFIVTN